METPSPELDYIIRTNPDIDCQYIMFADYYYWRGDLILCIGDAAMFSMDVVLRNRAVMFETLAREDSSRAFAFEAMESMAC